LSVSDNGCGISDEDIARITEPFYRIDKARSREQGGAGLGLTLCRQIAEVHGAEMIIESLIGSGTKVTITFTNP
jgi:signal transduction histidine kinase